MNAGEYPQPGAREASASGQAPEVGERLASTFLGVDVGNARVGLAVSDPEGRSAFPLETLRHDSVFSELYAVQEIVEERAIARIYVGLPLTMRGTDSASTRMARTWASRCLGMLRAAGLDCSVGLIDERLTSATARSQLAEAGVSSRDFTAGVDQLAATAILQQALDMQKNMGHYTGIDVREEGSDD